MLRRLAQLLLLASLAPAGSAAFAQSGGAQFELGMQGAVVAQAWNPLRLVLRDLPPVELEVVFDQGTLRSGPILTTYTASVAASRGVRVFEDELFVPDWRSIAWTVRSPDRTVASGTLNPRQRDSRPLTLLVSSVPGSWLPSLPDDARPHEMAASALPSSAAAYAGVHALLIDGTAAAPSVESVAAAAGAGVVVLLTEPLPATHSDLAELVEAGPLRLGAGWLVPVRSEQVGQALTSFAGFPVASLAGELAAAHPQELPPVLSRITITAAGALYALLVLVLLRFGGDAGLPAALVVAILAAGAGWSLLRPERPLLEESRAVVVAAGGLGVSLDTLALRSLPGGTVQLGRPMRLLGRSSFAVGTLGTRLPMARWQRAILTGRPVLATGSLGWEGELLVNRGERALTGVLVVGVGPQLPLAPDEERRAVPAEEGWLPESYTSLLSYLPEGTALASDGRRVLVALPPFGGEL
ncbi:MAG: hypothetical protein WD314_01150 [Trueperaceae bacterium]